MHGCYFTRTEAGERPEQEPRFDGFLGVLEGFAKVRVPDGSWEPTSDFGGLETECGVVCPVSLTYEVREELPYVGELAVAVLSEPSDGQVPHPYLFDRSVFGTGGCDAAGES